MSFDDREEKILNILKDKTFVRNSDLARMLYVSVSTMRRDIKKLEQQGFIVKEHGICRLGEKLWDERTTYELREQQAKEAKLKMAEKAIRYVKENDRIMLDGSSSAYSIVSLLKNYRNVQVITNNAKVSYTCGMSNIPNISLGGSMVSWTFSFVGQETIKSIKKYDADIVFFSCKGVSKEGYLTDTFKEENNVRKEMMKRARKKVALIHSDKFGNEYLHNLCHVSEVDEIICEKQLPDYIMEQMKIK